MQREHFRFTNYTMRLVLDSNVLGHAFADIAPVNKNEALRVERKRYIARQVLLQSDNFVLHIPSLAVYETFNIFIKARLENKHIIGIMHFLFELIKRQEIVIHYPSLKSIEKTIEVATLKTAN